MLGEQQTGRLGNRFSQGRGFARPIEVGQALGDTIRMGCENAVRNCMNVRARDRVVIITDREREGIGQALYDQAAAITRNAKLVTMEQYGERPFTSVPDALLRDLTEFRPSVTFYAATAQDGEIRFRIALLDHVLRNGLRVRHAHMVGITEEMMGMGMSVDYGVIKELGDKVYEIVKGAKEIRVITAAGTDLEIRLRPKPRVERISGEVKRLGRLVWTSTDGNYHKPGIWGNLPAGEVFTCPELVNGTFVVDGVLGDYFSRKYGVLKTPVVIKIKDSFAVSVECGDKELETELWDYLNSVENGNRVGEVAIGINIGLTKLIGNLLQDEKFPGMHLAFGHPDPKSTGADWVSEVHIDCVILEPTILVDGRKIMENGNFLI
ncbi:aminopeptidase [Candidatus Micrarchaeota archaeon]|nr:aminopeptidase [Candidatus Micrarchaeota archaeon]